MGANDNITNEMEDVNKMQVSKYEEIGRNTRFLLGWRRIIIGGYIAILWGTLTFVQKLVAEGIDPVIIGFALFIVALICFSLWLGEVRSRELLQILGKEAVNLENEDGGYIAMSSLDPKKNDPLKVTMHTVAHDLIAYCAIIVTLSFAAVMFFGGGNIKVVKLMDFEIWIIIPAIIIGFGFLIDPLGISAFRKRRNPKIPYIDIEIVVRDKKNYRLQNEKEALTKKVNTLESEITLLKSKLKPGE